MPASLLATYSFLGSNPGISQKYRMDDTSKGIANTRKKNIEKKLLKIESADNLSYTPLFGSLWSERKRGEAEKLFILQD